MVKTVLFDIDGVLLSEERCFDASALSVWELIHSTKYLGIQSGKFTYHPDEELIQSVRTDVFDNEKVLTFMKSRGMNSNWDMVFLSFSYQLLLILEQVPTQTQDILLENENIDRETLKTFGEALPNDITINYGSFVEDFKNSKGTKQDIILYLNELSKQKLGSEYDLFSRNGPLWNIGQETYQEWYLGDEFVEDSIGKKPYQVGKKGFLTEEIPLATPEELINLFQSIKESGLTIGIGTGRPYIESYQPLKALGLLDFIDTNHMITSTDVLEAEKSYPNLVPLGKPAPYTYVHAYLGRDSSLEDVVQTNLPLKDKEELLIVGDSLADCLAAQAIGCHFAAVLTGLTGEDAREEFEDHNAEFILSNVLSVKDLLDSLVVKE